MQDQGTNASSATKPATTPKVDSDPLTPVSQKPKKKVDLGKLMQLTEMRKTYQVSKKLMRISCALICGLMFHFAFFAYNVRAFNLQFFCLIEILIQFTIEWFENFMFTNPIEVNKSQTLFFLISLTFYVFKLVQEIKAIGKTNHGDFDLSSMLGAQAGGALKMLDMFTNSGIVEKFTRVTKYMSYIQNFVTDIALFIFANFLMDAILMTLHKSSMFKTKDFAEADPSIFEGATTEL